MARFSCLFAARRLSVMVVLAVAVMLATSAQGEVIFHNGTLGSVPPGTDDVAVFLDAQTGLVNATAIFTENATHLLLNEYPEQTPEEPVLEFIVNSTPLAWTDYDIALIGADFYGTGTALLAPLDNPVEVGGAPGDATIDLVVGAGAITVQASQIARDGENATLHITFGDPVDPGEIFALAFDIKDVGAAGAPGIHENGVVKTETPVPEPAALATICLGALWGVLRRRRQS